MLHYSTSNIEIRVYITFLLRFLRSFKYDKEIYLCEIIFKVIQCSCSVGATQGELRKNIKCITCIITLCIKINDLSSRGDSGPRFVIFDDHVARHVTLGASNTYSGTTYSGHVIYNLSR